MKRIKDISITSWLEWRYFAVWKDFKHFMYHHELYCPDNGYHEQNEEILIEILHEYFQKYGMNCTSTNLDVKMRRTFSHINILLR